MFAELLSDLTVGNEKINFVVGSRTRIYFIRLLNSLLTTHDVFDVQSLVEMLMMTNLDLHKLAQVNVYMHISGCNRHGILG